MAEERKILPPIINIVKYNTCPDNHLHIIFMDKDKNELGELVLYDPEEARDFTGQLAENCVRVFGRRCTN